MLTDSSFTAVSLSGEMIFSHRHNCSVPGISYSNGNFLIYDMGNTSYTVGSGSENIEKFTSDNNINAADISKSPIFSHIFLEIIQCTKKISKKVEFVMSLNQKNQFCNWNRSLDKITESLSAVASSISTNSTSYLELVAQMK